MVASTRELQRLQSTHIAGQEGEDGYANATLPGDAQNGPLQNTRRDFFSVSRREQIVVPGTGEMSEDDQERSDAAQALWVVS